MVTDFDNDIVANKPVGLQVGPHMVTNGPDFDTPLSFESSECFISNSQLPKGYQSTASVELKFYLNGDEIKLDRVLWTILCVQNKASAWNREPGALNGLAWGDSEVDGTTDWQATPIIGGISITTSSGSVKLTDVVGERFVTLKAETTINGVPFTENIDVSFGKGPLSIFAKPPSNGGLKWATGASIAVKSVKNDITASSTTFPAATFCGGIVHVGSSDITFGGGERYFGDWTTGIVGWRRKPYTADFSGGIISGHWRHGDENPYTYYSITSKLPTIGQLIAVSAFNEELYSHIYRKGAAIAAGWPCRKCCYWTGEVGLASRGSFYAVIVDLANGLAYIGEVTIVTNARPFVACVLETSIDNIVANKPVGLQAGPHPVGLQVGPHRVTNGPDFDTPLRFKSSECIFPETELPKGYQSTASVELKFYLNGDEIKPDRVLWTILCVQNKASAWNRESGALNGLAWRDSEVEGATDWQTTPVIGGPSIVTPTGSVKLTDVVGERIVTLKAETTIKGVLFTETIDVSFGKGPLSVFAKPPSTEGLPWATANGIAIKDSNNDFTANSTTFPAATFCGGTVHVGSSDIIIGGSGPQSYTVDFSGGIISGHWRYGDKYPDSYYSITSKLPTIGQLVAVSVFHKRNYSNVKRKSAAIAAGWPCGIYITGQVYFYSFGGFNCDSVDLATGYDGLTFKGLFSTPFVACIL
jgi:hypothetical protein